MGWGVGLVAHSRKTQPTMKKQRKPNPPNVDDPRKRIKDHDLRICTWNVRTLYRTGAKYKADIIALQEMRWKGTRVSKSEAYTLYYSCHETRHEFGCGFMVNRRIKDLVSRFTPVDERIAIIRIKAKFFYISLICTQTDQRHILRAPRNSIWPLPWQWH